MYTSTISQILNISSKPKTKKTAPTKEEILKNKKEIIEREEFREKFYDLMFQLDLQNKARDTYNLCIDEITTYGYKGRIYLVPPLTFRKLSEYKDVLEENLKCLWIMKYNKFDEFASIEIVTKPLDEDFEYENPKLKPYEMFLGINLKMKPIKINCNKNNMFLFAGATGSGKTRFIWCMLLSWILGCGVNEVELYLADIAKDEFINFKYVKHVRYYASELEELYKMINYLKQKFEKRKRVISKVREEGTATNIEEYNQIYKTKMSYTFIFIDEFSIIMPGSGDSKEVKQMKQEILDNLCMFSKTCRSYGMFPVLATQKTVRDEIPSILKDMAAVRISFRANGGKSSESILGDDSAVGLLDRYAIYSLDGGCTKDYLFSPKLTTQMLNNMLKPFIDKTHKKVNLDEKKEIPEKVLTAKTIKKKKSNQLYPTIELEDEYVDRA